MTEDEFRQKKQALVDRVISRFNLTSRDIYFDNVDVERFEDFVSRLEQIEQRVSAIEIGDADARIRTLEAENAELRRRLSRYEPDEDTSSAH